MRQLIIAVASCGKALSAWPANSRVGTQRVRVKPDFAFIGLDDIGGGTVRRVRQPGAHRIAERALLLLLPSR